LGGRERGVFISNLKPQPSNLTFQGIGVGLKTAHYADIFADPTAVDWYEAISENYMDSYGRAIGQLERIRKERPVGLHGVSMSLGSADGVRDDYLAKLAELVGRIEPFVVSDHLCFSSAGGHNSHDLLPLAMHDESVAVAVRNIGRVQERLGRQILIENVSTYVRTPFDEMDEAAFIREVVTRSGCGLLLDVNNVIVNAHNHQFEAKALIDAMPLERVGEIHLAGHSVRDDYLFDDHVGPVPRPVWELLSYTLAKMARPVNLLVEWDTDVPAFSVLAGEAAKARATMGALV
jgi:uncharacterized protein (UPF0276 family)